MPVDDQAGDAGGEDRADARQGQSLVEHGHEEAQQAEAQQAAARAMAVRGLAARVADHEAEELHQVGRGHDGGEGQHPSGFLDLLHVQDVPRLRTNGVNTNGAAAKVMNVDRLGEKVRPGTFGNIKSRLMAVPKTSLCQQT